MNSLFPGEYSAARRIEVSAEEERRRRKDDYNLKSLLGLPSLNTVFVTPAPTYGLVQETGSRFPSSRGRVETDIKERIEHETEGRMEPEMEGRMEPEMEGQMEHDLIGRMQPDIEGRMESDIKGRMESDIEGRMESDIEGRMEPDIDGRMEPDIDYISLEGLPKFYSNSGSENELDGELDNGFSGILDLGKNRIYLFKTRS